MRRQFLALLIIFCTVVAPVLAQEKDIAGSKDHPLLKRFEGSVILQYSHKTFDELTLALERVVFDYGAQKFTDSKKLKVEGASTRILYKIPEGVSTLEVFRNYENELKEKGSEILFSGSQEELDNGYDRFSEQIFKKGLDEKAYLLLTLARDNRYLAAKLARPEQGDVYARVYITRNESWPGHLSVKKDQCAALVDVLETKPMKQRMVTVSSTEMATQINSAGRVALYGIYFDFNKTDLKPESEPTLAEIAKLLGVDTKLKLLVVGHTDNVGGFEFNRDLSQRRAAAVVESLVSRYKVSRERLFPFGVSYAAPVAANDNEDGRAKNRRVELARY